MQIGRWEIGTVSLFTQLFVHGLVVGSLYALVGVSWSLIYSTTRIFHFAHVLSLTFAVYCAATVLNVFHLPFWTGFPIAMICAACVGVFAEHVVYRPLHKRNASQLNVFLASLGLLEAGRFCMQLIWGANPVPIRGAPSKSYQFGSVTLTVNDMLWLGLSVLCIGALYLWLSRSTTGKRIRAVASNPLLSQSMGISPSGMYNMVFIVGSSLVGIAGFLLASSRTASLDMGLVPVLAGFTATFIGGVGNVWGSIAGGIMLGLAEQLSGMALSGEWQTVTAFTVLLIVLMFRPQGLFTKSRV